MRVAIYARVSTGEQQTLSMQIEKMTEYAKHRGWTLVTAVEDIGSGAKVRPQREELLKRARRREIDAILVWKLDRWGRSLADLITTLNELQTIGVAFVSLTESLDFSTPAGRAMAGMLSTFAEFERDIIRERVVAGVAAARERGKPHGRPRTAAIKKSEIIKLKEQGLNNSQIAARLKISRGSVIGLLKGAKIEVSRKAIQIILWLRVENNSKFVRGKTRVREEIEYYLARRYEMKKLTGWEYELTFFYTDDDNLEKQIYDLYQEMADRADWRNCFVEADFREKNGERSW
jgi:putative DNA-invertase from lambdoid prophage Rac